MDFPEAAQDEAGGGVDAGGSGAGLSLFPDLFDVRLLRIGALGIFHLIRLNSTGGWGHIIPKRRPLLLHRN